MKNLLAAAAISILTGCSFAGDTYNVAAGEERSSFAGEVLVFKDEVPGTVHYEVIGSFHLQSAMYGSAGQEMRYSAAGAAKKGANAILVERTGYRHTANSWASPYTEGKLLWVENYKEARAEYLRPTIQLRLSQLERLKEKGNISEQEYQDRRTSILGGQ